MKTLKKFLFRVKSQLRTLLTAIGMILLSFSIGTEDLVMLWTGFAFPFISAVWSWADGNFTNIGSWLKKTVQAFSPLAVVMGWFDVNQATALSTLLFLIIANFPSEK